MDAYDDLIYNKILTNKYLLITAPTGTGKSTHIPALISTRFPTYTVAIIQPRRLAVLNIYAYLKHRIHGLSYRIKHSRKEHKHGKITLMTDGMFIKDIMSGREYDMVIVDEVHERSVRIEFVLMWLKTVRLKKAIFMSATVDDCDVERYFGCERVDLRIRGFRAHVFYEEEAVSDYLIAAYYKIKSILTGTDEHSKGGYLASKRKLKTKLTDGSCTNKSKDTTHIKDILVFLSGEEDISELRTMLKRLGVDAVAVHSSTNYEHITTSNQKGIKDDNNVEKGGSAAEPPTRVILATNIAETSVTIPNVKYVIDTGVHKTKIFKNVNFMGVQRISKESADQRKGRCNRLTDGICYRLYTENAYNSMTKMVPEIMRCDLSDIILWMCAMEMDVLKWPFLVYPRRENVKRAIEFLTEIGAVRVTRQDRKEDGDKENELRSAHENQNKIGSVRKGGNKKGLSSDRGHENTSRFMVKITTYGLKLITYPLDAKLSNFMHISNDLSCGKLSAKIVSLINEENCNFLVNPQKYDILSLLDLMNAFLHENDSGVYNQYLKKHSTVPDPYGDMLIDGTEHTFDKEKFCKENKLNIRALERCVLTNNQLQKNAKGTLVQNVEKAFSRSFQHNLSVLQKDGSYKMRSGQCVYVHPSSYFFNKRVKKIVFVDVLCTSKFYVRVVGRYVE
ncbi:DEAH-box RNA helicase [Trachipleistophora hominis]|uniref:DEAH-box RNA helicase n=1 Tax=Trachipleistophora hominis TaxID=72359 RepID=L7JX17_TRAHO|nr:DEAH-box RNA helicase [Trachipleistophora hominis]